jgi:hypothetical protein
VIPDDLAAFIYEDALPRFRSLFAESRVRATFFVCGADAEEAAKAALLRDLHADGHRFGNHSHTHALNFRDLDEARIEAEVASAEHAIEDATGETPLGFRSPGYGFSPALLRVLSRRGYAYDSSLMPGPYGAIFRFLDTRLQRAARDSLESGRTGRLRPDTRGSSSADPPSRKTQYSRLADARAPLSPYRVDPAAPYRPSPDSKLVEMPAATSPLLRLPFQAGVCMRLGARYFDAQLAAFRRRPQLPLLFLFHGADLADLSRVPIPFFRRSSFFSTPATDKFAIARRFLRAIRQTHEVVLAEEWVNERQKEGVAP